MPGPTCHYCGVYQWGRGIWFVTPNNGAPPTHTHSMGGVAASCDTTEPEQLMCFCLGMTHLTKSRLNSTGKCWSWIFLVTLSPQPNFQAKDEISWCTKNHHLFYQNAWSSFIYIFSKVKRGVGLYTVDTLSIVWWIKICKKL